MSMKSEAHFIGAYFTGVWITFISLQVDNVPHYG